ncbi:S-phase kinase-associated protein 1-like [Phymastichus coffea]|uniref:S-phase kinase-associated protein 1-like n=1 Tax=Phymastichus coffea TaxID=108790 RepID=UPI00273AC572|nr:S-phase kinase-associated protein 1-like [Phymastichus coffea]
MMINLQSSDGQIFHVDFETIQQSTTIKTMLEDLGSIDNTDSNPIVLSIVKGSILEKVLEWCEYHKNDPPYDETEDIEKNATNIIPWDKRFMEVENNILFNIILAANYLDIKGLLDVGCKTVANMIKGKSLEEIRQAFTTKENKGINEKEEKNDCERPKKTENRGKINSKEDMEEHEPKKLKKDKL